MLSKGLICSSSPSSFFTETIFEPVNASLVTKTFYSASFSCNFYLFKYPFDTQVCSLLIKLDSADTTVVTFTVSCRNVSLTMVMVR